MKKIIISIIVILLVGFFLFKYAFRAPSDPTQDIQNQSGELTASMNEKLYRIATSSSKVTFSIGEILRGSPFTAVGVTNEIAGDIAVSSSSINIGTLAINAKTFKTDSTNRDGAIARFILKSEDPANEFIYFKPSGPVSINTSGTSTSFTVDGDLTISGVTKPESFDVVANITDEALTGKATLVMKRSDFNLVIPNVSFVASVDDEFTVVTDITAPRVQ